MHKLFNYRCSGAFLSLVFMFGLSACGDDGNPAATVRQKAIAQISRVIGKTLATASQTQAVSQVSGAAANASQVDKTGQVQQGTTFISNQQASVSTFATASQSSPAAKAVLQVMQAGVSPQTAPITLDETVAEMLDVLLQNPTTNRDGTVEYHPDATKLCGTAASGAKCRAELSHISIVLDQNGSESGTLSVRYDSFTPLVVGYAPNMLYFECDVEGIVGVITANSSSSNKVNYAGEGRFRVTISVTGERAVQIVTGVTKAIDFTATSTAETRHLAIAKAENAMRIALDGAANQVTMQYAIGEVSSSNTPTSANVTTGTVATVATSAHLDKLAASIELSSNNGTHTIHVSGVDMGENGFVSKTNDIVDARIKVAAEDLSLVENNNHWTLSFTKSMDVSMQSTYQTTTITAQDNTVLTKSASSADIHVDSGVFNYEVTRNTTPVSSASLQAVAGECLRASTSGENVLVPFVKVTCS